MPLPSSFWADLDRAVELAGRERERLLGLPGVVAVGAGQQRSEGRPTGRAAIVVTVERKLGDEALTAMGRAQLPATIEGVPVDVVERGAPMQAPAEAKATARAVAVKEKVAARWLATPNVTGIGVGYKEVGGKRSDTIAIRLYVERKLSDAQVAKQKLAPIPKRIDDVPTDVIEMPPFRPAASPSGSRADRKDPLTGGVSIGTANHPFGFGTYGATVFDRASGDQRMLSNVHVLDAPLGEDVVQPSPVGLDDSVQIGFQLDICNPLHFFRLDTPNTTLGTILAGAAVACAIAAALSDEIDPTRRGQEATLPPDGALTFAERHSVRFDYPELPIPGTPFRINTAWQYERQTTMGDLAFEVAEEKRNPHVLEFKALFADKPRYGLGETVHLLGVIKAPRDRKERRCSSYHCTALLRPTAEDRLYPVVLREMERQDAAFILDLFGEEIGRLTEDHGAVLTPARTGLCFYHGRFIAGEGVPLGPWLHYLHVQTVNTVPEGTKPEIAAQTIGGLTASQNTKPTVDVACGPFVFEDGHFDIELI